MTVAENMILGARDRRAAGVLDREAPASSCASSPSKHGLEVDPDAEVEDLPVGTQQRVEILKALSRGVDLLILDEPTAVLTPQETDELLESCSELAGRGTSIVFITHKLREVLAVADRITCCARAGVVGEVATAETDARELATMMVGRDVVLAVDKDEPTPGRRRPAQVQRPPRPRRPRPRAVDGFSLDVRAGEIVGVAGVEGNGQTRARRGHRRYAPSAVRPHRPARQGHHQRQPARHARRRHRPHPGGPRASRPRRVLLARRQPRAQPLRGEALRQRVRP